jgi:hypothetical protein
VRGKGRKKQKGKKDEGKERKERERDEGGKMLFTVILDWIFLTFICTSTGQ